MFTAVIGWCQILQRAGEMSLRGTVDLGKHFNRSNTATEHDLESADQLKRQALVYALALGGLAGCLDPALDNGDGVRSTIAVVSGLLLWALIPWVVLARNYRFAGYCATAIGIACFNAIVLLSGSHQEYLLGIVIPVAAAIFLNRRDALVILIGYLSLAITVALIIHLGWWVPPFDGQTLERGLLRETMTAAFLTPAIVVPIIWREQQARKVEQQEQLARASADESRRRMTAVADATFHGFVEATADGTIVQVEGDLLNTWGGKSLIGRTLTEFLSKFDGITDQYVRPTVNSDVHASKGSLLSFTDAEARWKDPRGNWRWVSITTTSFEDARQQSRIVCAIRDVDEVVRSREHMQDVSRVEGLGTVCAGLAHEFNNSLTVLGVLFDRISDTSLRTELRQAHQEAVDLTAGLLHFANRREPIKQDIVVGEFVTQLQPIVQSILGATIPCSWKVDCPDAVISGDPAKLQNVFVNLMANARHAMPDGGMVDLTIEASSSVPGELQESEFAVGSRCVRIGVRDTGCGMEDTILKRAIEPFFTTKPRGVGTGLGLATAHGTIRSMGGSLELTSDPGCGTTVRFALPIVAPTEYVSEEEAFPVNSPDDTVPGRSRLRVAFVDDRELLRNTVATILQAQGHYVFTYGSAEDYLRVQEELPVDVLITDIELPGMSGTDLARWVKERDSAARVVLTSGHRQVDLTLVRQFPETTRFLAKPFGLKDVTGVIDELYPVYEDACGSSALF